MIGEGTFSMIVSRNERVCSSSRLASLCSVTSSCVAGPAATLHGLIDDSDDAAVGELDFQWKGLAVCERGAQVGIVTGRIERERSGRDARVEQVADGAAAPDARGSMLYMAR